MNAPGSLRISFWTALVASAVFQACVSEPSDPGPRRHFLSVTNWNDSIGIRLIVKGGEATSISDTAGALFKDTLAAGRSTAEIDLGEDTEFTLMYTWNIQVESPIFEGETSTQYNGSIRPFSITDEMPMAIEIGIRGDSARVIKEL